MTERNVFHVTPSADGRWLSRVNDDGEAHIFLSREAALREARRNADRAGTGEVFIHRPDGSVEERLRVGERGRGRETEPTPSKVAITGHPVHPLLVTLPIAFFTALPVADIVFAATGTLFWAQAAFVLLAAGLIGGALAAGVGLVDFLSYRNVRDTRAAWWHLLSNGGVLGLGVGNLLLRLGDRGEAILPWGLPLSLLMAGLLLVGGWYGGELSYRHRIGVAR